MEMMNVFKEAREILRTSPDKARCNILRERVDACKEAYDYFCVSATTAAMQELLGHWTRLVLAINAMGPLAGDDPPAGRCTIPKQALAA